MTTIYPLAIGVTSAGMTAVLGTATALGVHLATDDSEKTPVRVASGVIAATAAAGAITGLMALSGLGPATRTTSIAKVVGAGAGLAIAGAVALGMDRWSRPGDA